MWLVSSLNWRPSLLTSHTASITSFLSGKTFVYLSHDKLLGVSDQVQYKLDCTVDGYC